MDVLRNVVARRRAHIDTPRTQETRLAKDRIRPGHAGNHGAQAVATTICHRTIRPGVIEDTIVEVCGHRDWYLAEFNVRTNHVHVVVSGAVTPEKMLGDLKAWCTRNLRDKEVVARDRKVWTDGGSTRYLWNAEDFATAADYVKNQQGPKLPRE
jgi:hypothetical protein